MAGSVGRSPRFPLERMALLRHEKEPQLPLLVRRVVEFPVYGGASDDLRITWKGELSSAPENPERNWLYVTSVNRFLLLYTGEDWEEPAIINSLNKCGWCILGFSALSYHYYND